MPDHRDGGAIRMTKKLKKKLCLIGSFGVGKTILVSKYVKGIFSEKYLSTVGVMISQKTVEIGDCEVLLMVWDLAGEDDFQGLRLSFIKGASGVLFVADGTRAETLRLTQQHMERLGEFYSDIPTLLLLNKADLQDQWDIAEAHLDEVRGKVKVFRTSAKTGENVEEAFVRITEMMIAPDEPTTEAFL
ncbi:MAG: GTP-binding protein [Verrucomicrobia bacterium]|nr:GTP-binding protein [Verrucomicrobiota bacterium]